MTPPLAFRSSAFEAVVDFDARPTASFEPANQKVRCVDDPTVFGLGRGERTFPRGHKWGQAEY